MDKPLIETQGRFVQLDKVTSKKGDTYAIATFSVPEFGLIKTFVPSDVSLPPDPVFGTTYTLGFGVRVDSRLTLGLTLVTLTEVL